MTEIESPRFTHEEVRRNFLKSSVLIAILAAIIMALSYYIGTMYGDLRAGVVIGLIVCVIVIPMQFLLTKFVILSMTDGQKLDLSDPAQRLLQSKVEGLSIAAGLKRTPDIYLIPSSVPNAFASGMGEDDAFIGVTHGLLEMMDDQELEGVIAHEISHIVHRDIMLSQLVVAMVSVILILAVIAERMSLMRAAGGNRRRDNDSGGGLIVLIVILALLLRPLAMLIGSLIQMAVSRTREFAADAYAVRLCNYNGGLASALEKLGSYKEYTKAESESLGGSQLSCMYISFPDGETLFSTHPPIAERVKRIRNMY